METVLKLLGSVNGRLDVLKNLLHETKDAEEKTTTELFEVNCKLRQVQATQDMILERVDAIAADHGYEWTPSPEGDKDTVGGAE